MGFAITTLTLLLVFSAALSNAQLNFEGNPLTENTEYTAEETQSVERASRTSDEENTSTVLVNNVPQKLYPVYAKDAKIDSDNNNTSSASFSIEKSIELDPNLLESSSINNEARNLQDNSLPFAIEVSKNDLYVQQGQQNPLTNYALNTFLQSKTPEESKQALDYYIKSQSPSVASLSESSQLPIDSLHQISNDVLLAQSLPYQSHSIEFHPNNIQFPQTTHNFQVNSAQFLKSEPPLQSFQSNPVSGFKPEPAMPSFQSNPVPNFQPEQPIQSFQTNPTFNFQPSSPVQSLPASPSSNGQPDLQIQRFEFESSPPQFQSSPQSNLGIHNHNVQIQSQPTYHYQPSLNVPSDTLLNSVSSHPQMQNHVPNPMAIPVVNPFQTRMPFKYGPGPSRYSRHQGRPMSRLRNKMPMHRVGPAFMYKNPPAIIPSSFPPPPGMGKYKGPPIEVIYTKPPVFNRQPIRHVSGPYAEASSIFPEMSHPPTASQKDIFWSQLYTQSYDPHYYNYIAKTGKIKPYLYGKLGDKEDEGIWSEMVKGFKKHGLKNIMNPGFLLGMTIPALTLMLTAMIQKRSLARADFGPNTLDQEKLDEYMSKLQKALHIYDDNKKASTNTRRRR